MEKDNVVITLVDHVYRRSMDIEVCLDISAYELFVGLNEAMGWGCDPRDSRACYLAMENPIALLKGEKLLRNFGIREGSGIHFVR